MMLTEVDARRFWLKVDKSGECWVWQGAINYARGGYGSFWVGQKCYRAHRVAYELTYADPGDLDVLHSCDNPACVRPEHLHLGTHQDNMQERDERGRTAQGDRHWAFNKPGVHEGESHPLAKLTAEQVESIRREYRAGGITQQQLGKRYGVSQQAIGHIVSGFRWKS